MKPQVEDSIQIEFGDNNILSSLFGVYDSNILLLEKINNVKIEYRGNLVKIIGDKISINETKIALEKLFNDAKSHSAIGEATPAYLHSPNAASKIKERFPNSKIIISIRNPIERAQSSYLSNEFMFTMAFDLSIIDTHYLSLSKNPDDTLI